MQADSKDLIKMANRRPIRASSHSVGISMGSSNGKSVRAEISPEGTSCRYPSPDMFLLVYSRVGPTV